MVQRFKPHAYLVYEQYGWDSEHPSADVKMNHDREGEWVKFTTYRDTTNQLEKQIESLKAIIEHLKQAAEDAYHYE